VERLGEWDVIGSMGGLGELPRRKEKRDCRAAEAEFAVAGRASSLEVRLGCSESCVSVRRRPPRVLKPRSWSS
jgi:hypothetical protein